MHLDWTTDRNSNGFISLRAANEAGDIARVVAIAPGTAERFLMPVRLSSTANAAEDFFSRPIEEHTQGLQDKIAAIDRLGLSECTFATRFRAARMLVACRDGARSETGWKFASAVVSQVNAQLPIPAVTQIDYDQKRFHETTGGTLDSIDFAVKHDPSAHATTTAFSKILESRGVGISKAVISVTGVGDLGTRLVQRFLDLGVGTVLVADRNIERLAQIGTTAGVMVVPLEDLPSAPCDAHILSADKSFNDEIGERWSQNPRVVAVGGPEAGLDRFVGARQILAQNKKEFIPSVLCGCLGLITNLEESLGLTPSLAILDLRFARLMDVLIARMNLTSLPLATVSERILSGGELLKEPELAFLRGDLN